MGKEVEANTKVNGANGDCCKALQAEAKKEMKERQDVTMIKECKGQVLTMDAEFGGTCTGEPCKVFEMEMPVPMPFKMQYFGLSEPCCTAMSTQEGMMEKDKKCTGEGNEQKWCMRMSFEAPDKPADPKLNAKLD